MKIKLEDQLDKMGPRLVHCVDRFVLHSDLVEFTDFTKASQNQKPQMGLKTFLMIKNL